MAGRGHRVDHLDTLRQRQALHANLLRAHVNLAHTGVRAPAAVAAVAGSDESAGVARGVRSDAPGGFWKSCAFGRCLTST